MQLWHKIEYNYFLLYNRKQPWPDTTGAQASNYHKTDHFYFTTRDNNMQSSHTTKKHQTTEWENAQIL